MRRLQDLDGYPDNLDVDEIISSNFPNQDIRDWAIDLLATEAEPWLDCEDETTSSFARSIIASCRPVMEAMAMNQGGACDEKILAITINTHLVLAKALVAIKRRAIELGVREE